MDAEQTSLRIATDVFEGPFDLLLHLVRINEMDIFDINIETITEQFLQHLTKMEERDIEVGGDYLVMAATLLNIKSRTILPANPHLEEIEEEEENAILTTQDLVRQLIEYRRFKEIAQVLGERETSQMRIHYRNASPPRRPDEEEELEPQEVDKLLQAFAKVVEMIGVDRHHEVVEDTASVEDGLDLVRGELERHEHFRLSDILRRCRTRIHMIVTVLALLELTRTREIRIEQTAFYDDIHIMRRSDQSTELESQPAEPITEE